jgi:hypothetical protein
MTRCHACAYIGSPSVATESATVSNSNQPHVSSVVWNGTLTEQLDLMAAVQHNCDCSYDVTDGCRTACSGHTMLTRDQRALDGLLWNRYLAKRLLTEEGISAP